MSPELKHQLDLVHELRGIICAGCGGPKKTAQTFCYGCFKTLSTAQQRALWKGISSGYVEAYAAARQVLTPGNTTPITAQPATPPAEEETVTP